jgi:hypothetical protein
MRALIGELGDEHSSFITPLEVVQEDVTKESLNLWASAFTDL